MNPKLRDPATSLQWDAALEAPPDQQTTPAVLIVRERPPRSVAWRLLPVALLTLLTGGLLAKQSTLAAWPKLLDDVGNELVAQVRHAPPAPSPSPSPKVDPAPVTAAKDFAPLVKKPAPEPAAPPDPTQAALAEIEREAEHQKAEQAERSRLQAEAERQAPPPREAPQRVRPRNNPEDIARFQEHARQLREQQLAQMRLILEDAQRRQDAWRRQMGLPPTPPMMRFDALRDFGIDPNQAVPPPPAPGIIDANPSHARKKTLRESSAGQDPMRRGNIGLDRANANPIPDAVERATLRPLVSPDGRLIGYQWRLNRSF